MIKFKIIKGEDGYQQGKDFRYEILNKEMGFSDGFEECDRNAFHIIGREEGIVMCYARLHKIGEYVFCIDKMAVRKEDREQYVGDTMIRALEDKAVSEIGAIILTNVPENAWEFFSHEDYIQLDDAYEENGVKYKKMKRDLTKVRGCRGGHCK